VNELDEGGVDEIIARIDRNKNGSIDYTGKRQAQLILNIDRIRHCHNQ